MRTSPASRLDSRVRKTSAGRSDSPGHARDVKQLAGRRAPPHEPAISSPFLRTRAEAPDTPCEESDPPSEQVEESESLGCTHHAEVRNQCPKRNRENWHDDGRWARTPRDHWREHEHSAQPYDNCQRCQIESKRGRWSPSRSQSRNRRKSLSDGLNTDRTPIEFRTAVGAPIFTHSLSDNGQDPAAVWTVKRDAIEVEFPICHIKRLAALRAARLAQIPQGIAAGSTFHADILTARRSSRPGVAESPRFVRAPLADSGRG
jgi:hypothetical protein